MFYVYLLSCEKDKSRYIGQTDNLKNRLEKHNSGKILSTKSKKPWKLIKYEEYKTRNGSRWREYTLKHNTNERLKFYGE